MLIHLLTRPALALELTAAEVARHDQPEDCWMILEDRVYDLSPWVQAHPGGAGIERGCGKDATWFFQHRDEAGGHSEQALAILPGYELGALGAEVEVAAVELPDPHPHEARLERARMGLLPTAGVGPKNSIALRVGHNISTSSAQDSGIGLQAGYSFGFLDLLISDEQAAGIGGLELKARALDQHGERGMPLSLALVAGSGMGYAAGEPMGWGQLVLQRDLLDRRMLLAANSTGAMAFGAAGGLDSAQASAGLAFEFRPLPIHGVFAEAQVPFADPSVLTWSAGLSLYTRRHAFAVFASSTPSLHPAVLAGPAPQRVAIGASMERSFQL
jgi:hypothetical protein